MNKPAQILFKIFLTFVAPVACFIIYTACYMIFLYLITGDQNLVKASMSPASKLTTGWLILTLPALVCVWYSDVKVNKKFLIWLMGSGIGLSFYHIVGYFLHVWAIENLDLWKGMIINSTIALSSTGYSVVFAFQKLKSSK